MAPRRASVAWLAAAVLVACVSGAAASATVLTTNTVLQQTATTAGSNTNFEYEFTIPSEYVLAELWVKLPSSASASIKASRVGMPTGSSCNPSGGCVRGTDEGPTGGDVYAVLPAESFIGTPVYAVVSVSIASPATSVDFTIEAVGHAAQTLTPNDAVHVDPPASTGVFMQRQVFKVDLDAGAKPTVFVTMDSGVTAASVYVGTNFVPTTTEYTAEGEWVIGKGQKYEAPLASSGVSYILVTARDPYTIEVDRFPLSNEVLMAIGGGLLLVTVVVCTCVGCKTLRGRHESPELLRVNSYLCYCIGVSLLVGPLVMIGIGLWLGGLAFVGIGLILPAVGAGMFVLTLVFIGHVSVELDAKRQVCTVRRYYCVVCPRTRSYPFSKIREFYTMRVTSKYSDGSTTVNHCSYMRLTNGQAVKLDSARSNHGFRSRIAQMNGFLVQADPSSTRQQGNGARAGETLNPIVAATAQAVQLQAMQRQLQQQQLIAMQQAALAQAQAQARPRVGGNMTV